MSRIDHFLNSQIQGELVEVGAEFTVDPELGRAKLKPFTEAVPTYGLLRYVQGLHQLGASQIDIHFEPQAFRVVADFKASGPLCSDIKKAFDSCELFDGSGLASLASGLVAMTLLPPKSLVVWADTVKWDLHSGQVDTNDSVHSLLEVKVETERGSGYDRFDFMNEIQRRCRFAPCSITVDEKPLRPTVTDTKVSAEDKGQDEYHTEWVEPGKGFRYDLVELQNYHRKDQLLILTNKREKQPEDDFEDGPVIYGGVPEKSFQERAAWIECSHAIAFDTGYKTKEDRRKKKTIIIPPEPAQVILLRHGVVCESMSGKDFLDETLVMLDCSDLKSDLSGLRTVTDELFEAKLSEIKKQMLERVECLATEYRPALLKLTETVIETQLKTAEKPGCLVGAIIYLATGGKGIDSMLTTAADESTQRETERLKAWLESQS